MPIQQKGTPISSSALIPPTLPPKRVQFFLGPVCYNNQRTIRSHTGSHAESTKRTLSAKVRTVAGTAREYTGKGRSNGVTFAAMLNIPLFSTLQEPTGVINSVRVLWESCGGKS